MGPWLAGVLSGPREWRRGCCEPGVECPRQEHTVARRGSADLPHVRRVSRSTAPAISAPGMPGAQLSLRHPWAYHGHDSIGVGEDGPTHQPVEQLVALRAIPGLITLWPADANEVVEAYRYVMQLRHQPAVLALTRQPLPTLDRRVYASAAGVARGAYVLADPPGGNPDVILIASGSELSLAVEAHDKLLGDGVRA